VDENVYFQVIPESLWEDMNKNKVSSSFLTNYREFIFQIWPKISFEAHKEFRKALKQKKKLMSNTEKDKKKEIEE
jgi:hypothetical protein